MPKKPVTGCADARQPKRASAVNRAAFETITARRKRSPSAADQTPGSAQSLCHKRAIDRLPPEWSGGLLDRDYKLTGETAGELQRRRKIDRCVQSLSRDHHLQKCALLANCTNAADEIERHESIAYQARLAVLAIDHPFTSAAVH